MTTMYKRLREKSLVMFKGGLVSPFGIFVLVLVVYLVFFCYFFYFDNTHYTAGFPIRDGSDGPSYAQLAKNLISNQVFSLENSEPFLPNTFRTPGYPVFVALISFIFGSFVAVSFIQIIITSATSVIIYIIARPMTRKNWAFVAALLYAFGFTTITLSLNLMSEAPFILAMLGVIYLLFFYKNALQKRVIFSSGLLLGVAILIRPIGLYLPIIFAFFYFMVYRDSDLRPVLRNLILFFIGCTIIVMPWMARNANVSGQWSLTSLGPYDVLFYNVGYFLADKKDMPDVIIDEQLRRETGITDPSGFDDVANSGQLWDVVLKYLKEYPFQYARWHAIKVVNSYVASNLSFFLNEASRLNTGLVRLGLVDEEAANINRLFVRGEYGRVLAEVVDQPLLFLDRFFWFCVSLLMFVPIFTSRKDGYFWHKMMFLIIPLYFAVLSAPIGDVRYRLPSEPFIFILAVWGMVDLRKFVLNYHK